jgi:hypothetical protein
MMRGEVEGKTTDKIDSFLKLYEESKNIPQVFTRALETLLVEIVSQGELKKLAPGPTRKYFQLLEIYKKLEKDMSDSDRFGSGLRY